MFWNYLFSLIFSLIWSSFIDNSEWVGAFCFMLFTLMLKDLMVVLQSILYYQRRILNNQEGRE